MVAAIKGIRSTSLGIRGRAREGAWDPRGWKEGRGWKERGCEMCGCRRDAGEGSAAGGCGGGCAWQNVHQVCVDAYSIDIISSRD
jgi:hypothetical protein